MMQLLARQVAREFRPAERRTDDSDWYARLRAQHAPPPAHGCAALVCLVVACWLLIAIAIAHWSKP